jgi:hypothetical protein
VTETTWKKRPYRKHPKPDAFCPKQPLSAYQMFSLKVREDLKDEPALTFVQIARLVGEKWQTLAKGNLLRLILPFAPINHFNLFKTPMSRVYSIIFARQKL